MKKKYFFIAIRAILIQILFFFLHTQLIAQADSSKQNSNANHESNDQSTYSRLSDLDCLDESYINTSKSVSIKASFSTLFSTEVDKNSLMIIQNFIKYKDIHFDDTTSIRIYVGLRLYVKVSGLKISASSTLSQIAAAVSLGKANASYRLKIFGLTSIDYTKLPNADNFDATTYTKIVDCFNAFINGLKDTTTISPQTTLVKNYLTYTEDGNYNLSSVLNTDETPKDSTSKRNLEGNSLPSNNPNTVDKIREFFNNLK